MIHIKAPQYLISMIETITQPACSSLCSKLTIETLEKGVKYVQN